MVLPRFLILFRDRSQGTAKNISKIICDLKWQTILPSQSYSFPPFLPYQIIFFIRPQGADNADQVLLRACLRPRDKYT